LKTLFVIAIALGSFTAARAADVSGRVRLTGTPSQKGMAGTIVYLIPIDRGQLVHLAPRQGRGPYRLVQKGKAFSPHLLIVPVGADVEFPNLDRVFHNVFSVYENTQFDLGLYEAGSTKKVHFGHPGASFIFCNIHPEMSAVVFAIETPLYAVSGRDGEYHLTDVPDGEYQVKVWSEHAEPDDLNKVQRTVKVHGSMVLPDIVIKGAASIAKGHKNKFGKDYDLSAPSQYPY
jgi:hypothetical protein